MTRRHLILLALCAALLTGCAAAPTASTVDLAKARELSDQVVNDMLNGRGAAIRAKTEDAARAKSTDEQFDQALVRIGLTYGKLSLVEFKTAESGFEPREIGGRKPMLKFWYAAATDQHEMGTHFVFVQIVPDGARLACSAYSMVTFPNGVPKQLK